MIRMMLLTLTLSVAAPVFVQSQPLGDERRGAVGQRGGDEQPDLVSLQGREHLLEERPALAGDQLVRLLRDRGQLLGGGHRVGPRLLDPAGELLLETRDAAWQLDNEVAAW